MQTVRFKGQSLKLPVQSFRFVHSKIVRSGSKYLHCEFIEKNAVGILLKITLEHSIIETV